MRFDERAERKREADSAETSEIGLHLFIVGLLLVSAFCFWKVAANG